MFELQKGGLRWRWTTFFPAKGILWTWNITGG
ncbi:hypothetical protein ULO1_19590, partial [Carboxydocella sp. ULO1]